MLGNPRTEVLVFSGKSLRGVIKCRSMDKPGTIIGFKIGHALVDEIDVMPMDKATNAWRKILARMRYNVPGLRNGVDVTTTPEGFKFVYNQFAKQVREKPELAEMYGLIKASTYDNEINPSCGLYSFPSTVLPCPACPGVYQRRIRQSRFWYYLRDVQAGIELNG